MRVASQSFEFESMGGGRFAIRGVFGFATVSSILERSHALFEDVEVIKVDFSGVSDADSAGLALLLEWVSWAKFAEREMRFFDIPPQIQAVARISEVEGILHAAESLLAEPARAGKQAQAPGAGAQFGG
ncbi:MAG TPA: STAS domain-containing protein [Steroidobacteraceae bacterium]|nr:STAS domain-containing protein [Steroidobacteraceae bacterium]